MSDVSLVDLIVRTVVSLGVVLAIVGVAYAVVRRRAGAAVRAPRSTARSKRPAAPKTLETVARVGLSRGSAAVAVRFGDRVLLVGVTDGAAVSVLEDMPADRWDELGEAAVTVATPVRPDAAGRPGDLAARPSFLEALREATTRRG